MIRDPDYGLFIGVQGKGAYTFFKSNHHGYIAGKLQLLDGDAMHMSDLINDQLYGPGAMKRVGEYAKAFTQ